MTIHEQIEIARKDVRETAEELNASSQTDTARLATTTFEVLLPSLIDSAPISPVHHPTTVMRILLAIAKGDGVPPFETRALLLSSLSHDAYLGVAEMILSLLPAVVEGLPGKIRAGDVRNETGERKKRLIERGILERTLHNQEAARQIPAVLAAASVLSGVTVASEEIEMIRAIVVRHDLPSVAQLKLAGGQPVGPGDLFGPGDIGLRFRQPDRMWMVTREGSAVDVERDLAKGASGTDFEALRRQKVQSNADRHYQEYQLYADVFKDQVDRFGFIDKSLYTSPTAFRMFRQFVEVEG